MSPLRTVILSVFLSCLVPSSGWSQGGSPGNSTRDGDQIQARASNAQARARVRALCTTLYPPAGRSRERRAGYPNWIKDLICQYIVADFRRPAARRAYVERALAAFRQHGTGAWRLANRAPISHIVTKDPAYLQKRGRDASASLKILNAGATVRRSLRNPAAAAIGIHQSLFATPPATTLSQATGRIPTAESLLLRILGLAVVADMITSNTGSISKRQSGARINLALTAFQRRVLTLATIPKLGGVGIEPRPTGSGRSANTARDDYQPPAADVGRNILPREPAKRGKTFKITEFRDDDTLGLTRGISGIAFRQKYKSRYLKALESIEPAWKFKKVHILFSVVRTFLVIEIFYGVPRGKKALRVVSADGKTDCTPAIRRHENRHMADVWKAWRKNLVLAMKRDLSERSFEQLKQRRVRIYASTEKAIIADRRMRVTYLDIHAAFVFPSERFLQKARTAIRNTYKKANHDSLRVAFNKQTKTDERTYHTKEQQGLDDNCRPIKGGKNPRIRFGDIGKGKNKKPGKPKLREN